MITTAFLMFISFATTNRSLRVLSHIDHLVLLGLEVPQVLREVYIIGRGQVLIMLRIHQERSVVR